MKKLTSEYKIESRENCVYDFITIAKARLLEEREIAIETNDIEQVRYTRILLKILNNKRLTQLMLDIANDD